MIGDSSHPSESRIPFYGKLFSLIAFVVILNLPTPEDMSASAQRLAAVTVLMAILWMTQALPIAATSLIPLFAFPLFGIQNPAEVSQSYINQNIFLYMGGFIIALGIEKWGVHRRIALHTINVVGSSPRRVVLGFLFATGFLSMWISNTASTLLMLPIGMAIIGSMTELSLFDSDVDSAKAIRHFSVALLLGIAYSASIGGVTTLIGTPTNIAFQQIWLSQFPQGPQLSAGEWMIMVVPFGVTFILITWLVLCWKMPHLSSSKGSSRNIIHEQIQKLGQPTRAEVLMLIVFATTAILWVTRKPLIFGEWKLLGGWEQLPIHFLIKWGIPAEKASSWVHDSTVAMGMAILMFAIPACKSEDGKTEYLMDWDTAERLPWGVLLLIGGGFAIAGAFKTTALSNWVGHEFSQLIAGWPAWALVLAACLMLTFLTEFTSNIATVNTVLPILAAAAISLEIDPRLIMIPAAISASCAFTMPIATPPNAIVFASGKIKMSDMLTYGIILNLIGVVLLTAFMFFYFMPQMGIHPGTVPDWLHSR
ncbi:Sodium-dependent dicarboxylate transporter SdcS [Gimesia panareensis]|uniref:Sodium-dependent dicarboxylate transporter SdcS n=1 Tax=Gimesia panareensis TaxID=2527978 RepID=A0A518FJ75_9PLAN|nr:SLC13 family permease [Gimesia panareensis]QDV16394.1 Sodium-dependent dicarboxylate transporter SdcS [Gimesia panareensis]